MSRKFKLYDETFPLEGAAIDGFSEVVEEALADLRIERQNRLRIRLAVEECLLKFRDRFGEDLPVEIKMNNRLGRPQIVMEVEGEAFNPISAEIGDWSDGLLSSVGFVPQYSYAHGRNTVRLTLPAQRMNLALKTAIMIVIGVIVGWVMDLTLSDHTQDVLTDVVLEPIFQMWSEVLVTVAGPVIFLMILSTMLDTGLINRMGGNSWAVLWRYLLYTLIFAVCGVLLAVAVFHPSFEMDRFGRGLVDSVMKTMDELIPDTILEPISEANTPQILLVTFIMGTVILAVRDRVRGVIDIIKQLGIIGTEVAVLLSRLVPYVAMIFVITKMLSPTQAVLIGVWQPLLLALCLGSAFLVAAFGNMSLLQKVSGHVLLRKLAPSFLTVLRTGRLDASYGMTERACWAQLGIQREYTMVSLPYGLVIFVPVGIAGVLIFTIYAASTQHVVMTPLWIVGAIIMTILIYEVTPPLPGVDLLTYIAVFQQMGIDQSAVIPAMVFDILFFLFASAANQSVLQLELVMQAERYGLLNRDVLRKDI